MEEVKKRASRYTRDTVKRNDDVIVRPLEELTPTELTIIRECYQHYADVRHLAALTNRAPEWIRRVVRVLKRAPNLYITVCRQQRADKNHNHFDGQRLQVLTHGEQALEYHDEGLPLLYERSSSFPHDKLADDGIMSLKIGLKHHPEIEYITPARILAGKNMPAKTRENTEGWTYFPLKKQYAGHSNVHPDYFPGGFKRSFDAPNDNPYLVPEFETGANGYNRKSKINSSLRVKILSWVDVLENETYWHHMGLGILYIAFIHHNTRKTLEAIQEHAPKKYWPFFLVKQHSRIRWTDKNLPNGWMLEGDFMRVGNPAFNLLTSPLD